MILSKYINETAPEIMVRIMLDGIRVQGNMTIAVDMNDIANNLMSDWFITLSYMCTKVSMSLHPQSGEGVNSNDGYN